MKEIFLHKDWELINPLTKERIPAKVPGSVHTDLLAAGKIDDPFYRDNENTLMHIGEQHWLYETRFNAAPDILKSRVLFLRMYGLDTLAEIRLNDQLLGKTRNMYCTVEYDVHTILVAGENRLSVLFQSTFPRIKKRQAERRFANGGGPLVIKGASQIRKSPCNYGWDWGPRCVTCGIWQPVSLIYGEEFISEIKVRQQHFKNLVLLQVTAGSKTGNADLIKAALFDGEKQIAECTALPAGKTALLKLKIANPKLWWPAGEGKAHLYRLEVSAFSAGKILDLRTQRIGLRTIKLDQKKDKWGTSFVFTVNGKKIFCKGADWIPADVFYPRVENSKYRFLLESAILANMNMIRVWGGGIYENDIFYNLCDELGIMVWQDFMFACAAYPSDREYISDIKQEIADNVKRLRHHASLALWCGNNEIEMIKNFLSKKPEDGKMTENEYKKLFHEMIPQTLKIYDDETAYWPSSPHTPGDFGNANSELSGDAHLWAVWHGRQPFEWYRTTTHRFISEFGFQSFPCVKTLKEIALPEDLNFTSRIMEHHQRSRIGNEAIINYMLEWFRLPSDFKKQTQLSMILQGLAIAYGAEHWRRIKPRCMGTLFWQLNDCWQGASWSSVDYRLRWKALQYMARRFFEPLALSAVENQQTLCADIFLVSDWSKPAAGKIKWQAWHVNGKKICQSEFNFHLSAGESKKVGRLDCREILKKHGLYSVLFGAECFIHGKKLSETVFMFSRPKHIEITDPEITVKIKNDLLLLRAARPALFVTLESDHVLSDNFFHMFPGRDYTIRMLKKNPGFPDRGMEKTQITSLYEICNVN